MTEIPLDHFYVFSLGVYKRLKYLIEDKNGQRTIIASNAKGWNTFIHLVYWGMSGIHTLKTNNKKKVHGYKSISGEVWEYTEYHVEHILSIFKKLGIIDFYYYKKTTNLPRTNLNDFSTDAVKDKIVPYERIFRLKELNEIELNKEMKKYFLENDISLNPKGLLLN